MLTSDLYFLFASCIASVLIRFLMHVLSVRVRKTLYHGLRYSTVGPPHTKTPSLLFSTHTDFTSSPLPPPPIFTSLISLLSTHSSNVFATLNVHSFPCKSPLFHLPLPSFPPWLSSCNPTKSPLQAIFPSSIPPTTLFTYVVLSLTLPSCHHTLLISPSPHVSSSSPPLHCTYHDASPSLSTMTFCELTRCYG